MLTSLVDEGAPRFALSDEHRLVLEQVERFARRELHPLQERMDRDEWWPDHVFPALGSHGYLGVTAPPRLGGRGRDFFSAGLVLQAVARWNPAIALALLAHDQALHHLLGSGDEELCERFVPGMCEGSIVGALGISEPGAGSGALEGMRTTARRHGEDYVLGGTEVFVTNGSIADVVVVYAQTASDDGTAGVSAFVVETDMPGFTITRKLQKMGMRGSQTAEIALDDCYVPASHRVGRRRDGVTMMMKGLALERVWLAFMIVGMAERALELAIEHAGSRRRFGAAGGEFQLVQGMLADIFVELESVRSFAYHVGAEVTTVPLAGAGAHWLADGEVARRAAAVALKAGLAFMEIVDRALQIHGGAGYIWETEINRLYRAGKLLQIGAGANEVLRVMIARDLLAG
jgi:isovaleryl-CoA dehydrogenase